MRYFKWRRPIAMRWGWVSMPYTGKAKWNKKSPGLMLYHLFTRRKHAPEVDREMRTWFHPMTPKRDTPWGGVFHYTLDWRAAQRGTISIRAYRPVKDQILTMVSKARDFQSLTTVVHFDTEIHGLLKQSPTKKFGASSLLKILLAIKATLNQADAAKKKANENTQETGVQDEDASDSDDEQGFRKVKVTRRKIKSTKNHKRRLMLSQQLQK